MGERLGLGITIPSAALVRPIDVAAAKSTASLHPASGRRSEVLRLFGRGVLVAGGALGISLLFSATNTAHADDRPEAEHAEASATLTQDGTPPTDLLAGLLPGLRVLDPVTGLLTPVTGPLLGIVAPQTEALTAPVTDLLAPIAEPLLGVVAPVLAGPQTEANVAQAADVSAESPVGAVPESALLDPVTDLLAPVTESVLDVVAPVLAGPRPEANGAQAADVSAETSVGAVPESASVKSASDVAVLASASADPTVAAATVATKSTPLVDGLAGLLAATPALDVVAATPLADLLSTIDGLGLSEVLRPILSPVLSALDPVLAPVLDVVDPVVGVLAPVLAPVAGILEPVVAPVATLLDPVLAPVVGIVDPVVAPILQSSPALSRAAALVAVPMMHIQTAVAESAPAVTVAAAAPAAVVLAAAGAPVAAGAAVHSAPSGTSSFDLFAVGSAVGVAAAGPVASVSTPASTSPSSAHNPEASPADPAGVVVAPASTTSSSNSVDVGGGSSSHATTQAHSHTDGHSGTEIVHLEGSKVLAGVFSRLAPTPE